MFLAPSIKDCKVCCPLDSVAGVLRLAHMVIDSKGKSIGDTFGVTECIGSADVALLEVVGDSAGSSGKSTLSLLSFSVLTFDALVLLTALMNA